MDEATRARLEHVVLGTWPILTLDRGDVLALLTAYDALRAERDAARADYRALWDEHKEDREETTRVMIGWQHKAEAAEQRATRLAALEAAARAWARHRAIARDPQTEPDVYWANTQRLVQTERELAEAVAALDGPAGEAG